MDAPRLLAGLVLSLLASSAAAVQFGHARFLSSSGEPLHIEVPLTELAPAELQALTAQPAAAADWQAVGLTPPVALDALRVSVQPAPTRAAQGVLRIDSNQPFSGDLADLLLEVRSPRGAQRYQVSLIAPQPAARVAPTAGGPSGAADRGATTPAATGDIVVRRGDTLWSIARRNAAPGVSIHQMMLALQRANPSAFIHANINLVRAGATLHQPTRAELLALSQAEALREFANQNAAFARLRGGASADAAEPTATDGAAQGRVQPAQASAASAPDTAAGESDALRLSDDPHDAQADAKVAQRLALQQAEQRVQRLEHSVRELESLLKAQAALSAADAAQASNGAPSEVARVAQAEGPQADGADHSGTASTASDASAAPGATLPAAPSRAQLESQVNQLEAAVDALQEALDSQQAQAGGENEALRAAQGHVDELQDHLHSLDQALKAQGEAARSTVAKGAHAVSESLQKLVDAIAEAGEESAEQSRAQTEAQLRAQATVDGVAEAGGVAATGVAAAAADAASSADAAAPTQAANGVSDGRTAAAAPGTGGAGSAASATPSSDSPAGGASPAGEDEAAAPPSSKLIGIDTPSEAARGVLKPEAGEPARAAWLQAHLLTVILALLALIVITIAWFLRRASRAREVAQATPEISEAMVREKLQSIDLNLDSPAGSTDEAEPSGPSSAAQDEPPRTP